MDIDLKVGGLWLRSIGDISDLEIVHRGGSPWMLTFDLALPPGIQPPALQVGETVEAHAAGKVWSGELTDPDWDTGEFIADGWIRQGEEVQAFSASYAAAASAQEAVAEAIGRGALTWVDGGLPSMVPYPPESLMRVTEKLDEYVAAISDGTGPPLAWRVNADKVVSIYSTPVTPTLFVPPGIVDIGTTTTSQTTLLVAQYVDTGGIVRHVRASTGAHGRVVERRLDLSRRGPMMPAQAQALVNGLAFTLGPLTKLSSGIEVTEGEVLDEYGQSVPLALIGTQPAMIRLQSTQDPRTGAGSLDFVIGETTWKPKEQTMQIVPVDVVVDDLEDYAAEQGVDVL